MGSYELFAWRDAMALGCLLEEEFDVAEVRRSFEQMDFAAKFEFERTNNALIEELIRRPEGQRGAYIRKVGKNANELTKGLLVAFSIVAQVRVMEVLELRDSYRLALAPGSGNRVTCASVYAFQQEIARLSTYEWPDEVFDAYGGNSGADDPDADD